MCKSSKHSKRSNLHPCPVCSHQFVRTCNRQNKCPECSRLYRAEYMRQYSAWKHGERKERPANSEHCTLTELKRMVAAARKWEA